MGTYVFRWPFPATTVYVTGTFDDWAVSEKLEKVGDIFEKKVSLPSIGEKIYYKFVVDGEWIINPDAPVEDDGHYNSSNILLLGEPEGDRAVAAVRAPTKTSLAEAFSWQR